MDGERLIRLIFFRPPHHAGFAGRARGFRRFRRRGRPAPLQERRSIRASDSTAATRCHAIGRTEGAGKGSSWKHDLHRSFAALRLVEVSIHPALADELYAAGKSKILPTMISKEAPLADFVAAGIRAADDRQGASSPCESRDDAQALQQDRLVRCSRGAGDIAHRWNMSIRAARDRHR